MAASANAGPIAATKLHAPLGTILLLGALTAFSAVSTDFYLPGLPALAQSLRAEASEAELTLALFFLGVAAGQLVYGPLSDRIGRRGPLLVGIALYTAASIGCALATSIEMLIFMRLLQGFGGCAGMVLARAVVRDRYQPQETAHIFSMLMLVMGVAPILAPLGGGFILTVAGWRALFWILAFFGAACGVATLTSLKESLPPGVAEHAKTESPARAYLEMLKIPRLIGYMLYGSFTSSALLTYVSASPDLLIRTYHVPPQAFGWIFGTNSIGLIGASQINRRLLRHYSYDQILVFANVGGIAAAAVLATTALTGLGGMIGVLVPLFFVVATLGLSMANTLAGALAIDPRRAGTTAALMGGAQFGAGFLASAAAGAFYDGTARPMAMVIVTVLVIAGVALHTLAKPQPA